MNVARSRNHRAKTTSSKLPRWLNLPQHDSLSLSQQYRKVRLEVEVYLIEKFLRMLYSPAGSINIITKKHSIIVCVYETFAFQHIECDERVLTLEGNFIQFKKFLEKSFFRHTLNEFHVGSSV